MYRDKDKWIRREGVIEREREREREKYYNIHKRS